ncbi:PIR protein, putative [Plasmodium sp. gorilla clade G1]|nr:PIR protein, putative [Plasmodium sp. gorilla clade G1]
MKVHYINILLFSFPLNILVYNQRNHKSTNTHTPISRLLCECDPYIPNYDNDAQMKEVMENFNKQTQQRFHEYDERMKTTRQKCKDQCDKEIQKIILKDKLEKQMEQQLTTLETKIDTDEIPTCICEKSMADKVEKGCLRCGGVLGSGVAPSVGLLGAIGASAVTVGKPKVLEAAIAAALKINDAMISAAGLKAGNAAGMNVVSFGLKHLHVDKLFPGIYNPFVNTNRYTEVTTIANSILENYSATCTGLNISNPPASCRVFQLNLGIHKRVGNIISTYGNSPFDAIPQGLKELSVKAEQTAAAAAKNASETVSTAIKARETALIEGGLETYITSIYASIIAIVVIVLIMVIIYLILRYRRKKKMKKKLQYIKLLKE